MNASKFADDPEFMSEQKRIPRYFAKFVSNW